MEAPERKTVAQCTVACIEHEGAHNDIGGVYHQLFAWAHKAGIAPTGQPFTIFLESPRDVGWQKGRFQVCLPVPSGTEGSGEVTVEAQPATDVLAVEVQGPYHEIPAHYAEFLAWIDYEGATIAGAPREVYIVHPAPDGSGDPAAFRTEIQFPVE